MIRFFFLSVLILITWATVVLHRGVFPSPSTSIHPNSVDKALWIPKETIGINQLFLFGAPQDRGYQAGKITKQLLNRQERELAAIMDNFIPSRILQRGLYILLMRWFWGIETFFEPEFVDEMWGISQFTTNELNYIADPLTRQVGYLGIHEVGQMFVDMHLVDMGCTLLAAPKRGQSNSWIIGRNFDFEAGRIFDEEKIMKWVFPDQGSSYLSVIWAGMVGGVTGVNEHGVYLSINAAGSKDFSRYGTPSTLVLIKALQYARTAEEAIEIIKTSQLFITDIFVVVDKLSPLYRIEKSPLKTRIIPHVDATIISNHLIHADFKDDPVNRFRKTELTSVQREKRGIELLHRHPNPTPAEMLTMLRDKQTASDSPILLGNRATIDSLIATHSVIYDTEKQTFYVSKGPSLVGESLGFDLKRSFALKHPVLINSLPSDPTISVTRYFEINSSLKQLETALALLRKGKCLSAKALISQSTSANNHYLYHLAQGNLYECTGDLVSAKLSWQRATSLNPSYSKHMVYLKGKLNL